MILIICFCSSPYRQNDYGQVGSGSNENAVVPRFVRGVDHVLKVACGANHNLALTGTVMSSPNPIPPVDALTVNRLLL